MAALNLAARREHLADALEQAVHQAALTVYPRWPDTLRLPALIVWPVSSSGPETFDGAVTLTGELLLLVEEGDVDPVRGQEKLDAFLSGEGPDLITQAADEFPELNVSIGGWTDYGLIEDVAEARFWGVRFPFELF